MALDRLVGVDVGGSRIKGAVVRPKTGTIEGEPVRRDTPLPATPSAMTECIVEIIEKLQCSGPVGVALPCVVRHGVVRAVANIHKSWVGVNAVELLTSALGGRPVTVLNDADAAGLAEAHFGQAHGRLGTVLVLTFGTGIGSALVHDGRLVPNTELGHLKLDDGMTAEKFAAASIRESEGLTWEKWCERVNSFLALAGFVVQADLIVVGGGISEPRKKRHWSGRLHADAPVVPASLANRAGMIGAALQAAAESHVFAVGPSAAS